MRTPPGAAVAWRAAAEGLDAACRASIESACVALGAREERVRGVERLDVGGMSFALKRGRRRGLRGALLRLGWTRTRSARAAELAERMEQAGVRTPRALGVYTSRVPSADVLVMEWVDGRTLGERLGEDSGARAALVVNAARAVAALHSSGFTHRDLKGANLLVDNDDAIHFVDLDGARRETVTEDLRARDLARLGLSVELAESRAVDQLILAYDGARPESQRTGEQLARAVRARIQAKRARNQERGRPLS